MEYLHHFQLSEDPFRNDHLERFATEIPSQVQSHQRLDRAVRQGRGIVAVLGSAGSGKTVVARRLYEELEEEVFEAGMMVMLRSRADAEWLLSRFARQLGVEQPAEQREALVEQIYERLAIVREDGRHAVLIIDDADALASEETLAELCALVKLEYEERRMLTIVLVGSGALDRALRGDPALAHHVEARVEMRPMRSDEAADYLGQRIGAAGGDPQLLLPGAAAALAELSGGAPGRVNILADNALYEAFVAGRKQVARSDVERAFADLGWSGVGAAPAGAGDRGGRREGQGPSRGMAEVSSPDPAQSLADLDSELEAVFTPGGGPPQRVESRKSAMDFDAGASQHRRAASRAAAAPTEIQLGPADVVDPLPLQKDDDAVDELFMELIEE